MPEFEQHDNRDFSKFDNMSTEALEEILRLDSQLPEDEQSDMDAILYVMEVIAKREHEQVIGRFTDVETAWKSFNENYRPYTDDDKPLFEGDDNLVNTSSKIKITPFISVNGQPLMRKHSFLRTACVAAVVILAIVFTDSLTAYAFGYDLLGIVAKWTREKFGFAVESNIATQASSPQYTQHEPVYTDLQSALDSFDIAIPLVPTWIPDEFVLEEVVVEHRDNMTVICALYVNGEKTLSIQISDEQVGLNTLLEKDEGAIETYISNGVTHYLMTNEGRQSAVWINSTYYVNVFGDISRENILRIIDSIYIR